MLDIYRKLFSLLNRRERMHFRLLMGLILIMGFADMVGVGAILPFLGVVANPDSVHDNAWISWAYEWLGAESAEQFTYYLGVIVFCIIVFSLLFKIMTTYALARFSHMRKYSLSRRMLAGYLQQPYVWYLSRHSSDLTKTVLQEVDQLVGYALMPAMRILAQAVSIIFLIGLIFIVRWDIALISGAVLLTTYALVYLVVRRLLERLGRRRVEANKQRFRAISEVFGGIKDVKLVGLEEHYMHRFQSAARKHADALMKAEVVGILPRHMLEIVAFGGMIGLILYLLGGSDQGIGEMLPVLGLLAMAGLRVLPAVQQIYSSFTSLRFGRVVLEEVFAEFEAARNVPPIRPVDQSQKLALNSALELRQMRYGYPATDRAVVDGMDMRIDARTTVGVVGGTGAGKTTTIDIILGLLTPDAGEMLVDDQVITPERMRAWQNNIGYVPQQIFLLYGTISANIAFGVPEDEIDHAAVERAARLAELHDFVTTELKDGYATNVGERGIKLSGGQRQRIGIARALYHNPDILILDEATSALDNLTEKAVMDAIRNLGHDKTIIMIAHRLTTVKNCDTIFLLEGGRVTAQGSYDELIESNPTFREMALIA